MFGWLRRKVKAATCSHEHAIDGTTHTTPTEVRLKHCLDCGQEWTEKR